MVQTLRLTALFVMASTMLALCCPLSTASPDQKKPSLDRQDVNRISIQPEEMRFDTRVHYGIPEGYILVVSNRVMARRLLSALRQNHRLSYVDYQIKTQGPNPEPPQLEIGLSINGFYKNLWTLQLNKKHDFYPLQFQHNSQSENKLQLGYATVSPSQLKTFLYLLQIASSRAHHKQTGYVFVLIQGI